MSDNCNTKYALQRDGTSQSQRLLAALLPSYVSVDERSMEDFISFAKQFATEIQYYNLADAPEGDWVGFFTKSISEEQRNEPHYALFIAFLELYKFAQDDINTITKRHLDYYYREVLNLEERAEVPDQVFIIFELAEQLSSALVAKGKELDAKKDLTDVDLIYKTDKDIVVNHGLVEQLKSVFINRPLDEASATLAYPDPIPVPIPGVPGPGANGGNNWRLYASPVAKSKDGLGEELEGAEKRWRTFGAPKANFENKADRPQAEIGFAFASPLLFLAEGTRTVKIRVNFNRPLFSNPRSIRHLALSGTSTVASRRFSNELRSLPVAQHETAIADFVVNQQVQSLTGAVNIYFSGEEEWIAPETINSIVYETNGDLVIECTLSQAQKAVVAYNEEILLQPIRTEWPVVKITLNTNHPATDYIYHDLSSKTIFTANLEVNVTGVRNLVIQNDDSVLSADKPFEPFGGQPIPDSAFYIGSTEIFQKQLDEVDVNITWNGLPNQRIPSPTGEVPKFLKGFTSYYENYLPPAEAQRRKNENFRVNAAVLDKRVWNSVNATGDGFALFEPANDTPLDDNTQVIKINNNGLHSVGRNPKMVPVEEFGTETQKGFLRLTLDSVDFGHSIFQNSYTKQAIWTVKDSQVVGSANDQLHGATLGLPNDPYTPQIKEISVNYKSTETINLTRQLNAANNEKNYNARVEQFFHILPFGAAENHPHVSETVNEIPLLPQFPDEGSLYIGISALDPPQTISVLMKVAEGSANPDFAKQPVKWSYLYNDEWYSFTQLQMLSDSTSGLITSGIVSFDLPKAFNNTNTYLPEGLFWLKASVAHYTGAICDLIDVQAQAVTATYVNNGNDPNHLRTALPAETIKDFVSSISTINSISQPFASFGGRIKEQSNEFYVRVSERLRHKKRAVTIWDYEHLVLEQFPKIYKVKCLNHTRYTSLSDVNELTPGHISLVIIADLQNKNACDPLKPKTSLITLTEIQEYINAIKPPCVALHVRNPIFEEIQVEFQVKFLAGFDIGFYGQQLEEEIRQFLAPWTYGTNDIVFGGRVHKSMIINFVEDRPYVDFVTCFNMHQFVPTGLNTPPRILKDVDDAIATTSASILTSAPTHLITVLETEDCACDDNLVLQPMLAPPVPCDDCGQPEEKAATGIGADEITTTFIIGHEPAAGVDFWVIEQTFEVQ